MTINSGEKKTLGIKHFCVPSTVYLSVKWDKEKNRLDLDATWRNSLTLEHFGLFRKCLRDLAFLCIVVLGIAMRPGKEMGLPLIKQISRGTRFYPWWTDFEIPVLLPLHPKEAGLWQVTLSQGSSWSLKARQWHRRVITAFRQNRVMLN